ncbi:hypothetical protein D0A34_26710 [Microcoleus vaginatus PCC 9802]|jgi:hypothetical protein|nr:hypothetical protein D0A34_26710 [Microcoleus vaginatus PCC 9802]
MTVTFDEFEGEGGNIFEIIDIIRLKQCLIASVERWMTNCCLSAIFISYFVSGYFILVSRLFLVTT